MTTYTGNSVNIIISPRKRCLGVSEAVLLAGRLNVSLDEIDVISVPPMSWTALGSIAKVRR